MNIVNHEPQIHLGLVELIFLMYYQAASKKGHPIMLRFNVDKSNPLLEF